MKKFFLFLFVTQVLFYLAGLFIGYVFPEEDKLSDEGNFWRDEEREKGGWVIIEKDFSHIIYQAPDKILWTRCHSCNQFIKVSKAHKMIIDRRKEIFKRIQWDNRNFIQKIIDFILKKEPPFITMLASGRVLDYEELYYCDSCYKPDWNK